MRLFTILLLCTFLFFSCNTENSETEPSSEVDPVAFELNNSAMERYQHILLGFYETGINDSLELSLEEINKAINLEPSQSNFYSNKSKILLELERDREAIRVLQKTISIEPNFAEALTTVGFIYERFGESGEAQKWFSRAINAYEKRIEEDRLVVNSKVNKVFLLLFTENKEIAMRAYKELKKEYPDDSEVEFMEQILTNFDKEEFLSEI